MDKQNQQPIWFAKRTQFDRPKWQPKWMDKYITNECPSLKDTQYTITWYRRIRAFCGAWVGLMAAAELNNYTGLLSDTWARWLGYPVGADLSNIVAIPVLTIIGITMGLTWAFKWFRKRALKEDWQPNDYADATVIEPIETAMVVTLGAMLVAGLWVSLSDTGILAVNLVPVPLYLWSTWGYINASYRWYQLQADQPAGFTRYLKSHKK